MYWTTYITKAIHYHVKTMRLENKNIVEYLRRVLTYHKITFIVDYLCCVYISHIKLSFTGI